MAQTDSTGSLRKPPARPRGLRKTPKPNQRLLEQSVELVHHEAFLLDRKRWTEWIALYTEDAEFWVPAWDDDGTLTNDPRSEISLIYYSKRLGLEDRVARITSGLSSASQPSLRTCHIISGARVEGIQDGTVLVASNWVTYSYWQRTTQTFFGFYEHSLIDEQDGLKIKRKKIVVLNDIIPRMLDIYNV
jgi:benzoate/toluate 1,2-dioxygenase subunit beta